MCEFIAYFIAGVSTSAFLILWFTTVYHEVIVQKRATEDIANQLKMHQKLCAQAHNGPNEIAARKMLDNSHYIYNEVVKTYNNTILKPMNRFPAWIMGFRIISEEIQIQQKYTLKKPNNIN